MPRGKSPLVVREGETVELECLVSGKPKPIILWSRADKEVSMPDGSMQMESYDGVLRIVNVSREMSGSYRCQTSQYNGFNVKPREALVELIVQCKCPIFTKFNLKVIYYNTTALFTSLIQLTRRCWLISCNCTVLESSAGSNLNNRFILMSLFTVC